MVTLFNALGASGLFPIAHEILHANICAKRANANIENSSGTLVPLSHGGNCFKN